VARAIAIEIDVGSLRDGDRLPSERHLCEHFGVSRVTVRRALSQLAASGRVESRPRRGTFVKPPRLGEPPDTLASFTSMGVARGLTPSSRVLQATVGGATIEESEQFAVAPGAALFELVRVRCLDGLPVSVDHSRVPVALAHGIEDVDFATASLYAVLDAAGHGPIRADYTVEAAAATVEQADFLDLSAGAPLLLTHTVSYDIDGHVVERGTMAYRGDRYRFHATLTRGAPG
jgi:GntR family transcriptional regulator